MAGLLIHAAHLSRTTMWGFGAVVGFFPPNYQQSNKVLQRTLLCTAAVFAITVLKHVQAALGLTLPKPRQTGGQPLRARWEGWSARAQGVARRGGILPPEADVPARRVLPPHDSQLHVVRHVHLSRPVLGLGSGFPGWGRGRGRVQCWGRKANGVQQPCQHMTGPGARASRLRDGLSSSNSSMIHVLGLQPVPLSPNLQWRRLRQHGMAHCWRLDEATK